MSNTIPAPPSGELGRIFDQNDLYNDSYNQLPNLRWSDPEFHDRIKWLQEKIPFHITFWDAPYAGPAGPGPGAKEHRGSTHFQARLKNGSGYPVDVVNIATDPRSAFATLYFLQNGVTAPEIEQYPGYLVRNPVDGKDLVGQPWPEHKLAVQGRKIFHVSAAFDPAKWPYAADPKTEFWRPDGRYSLGRDTQPGPGLWGAGATHTYYWEKDYSRQGMDPELNMEGLPEAGPIRASREAINITAMPFEGLATATMNLITEVLRHDSVVRTTMDPGQLKRHDEVTIKWMERGDRIMDRIEAGWPK